MTWWHKASREARLAQIDGGIELGMTARQIALASGCRMGDVNQLAYRNGRNFAQSQGGAVSARASRRASEVRRLKGAYLRGEQVDFTGSASSGHDDFALDEVPA